MLKNKYSKKKKKNDEWNFKIWDQKRTLISQSVSQTQKMVIYNLYVVFGSNVSIYVCYLYRDHCFESELLRPGIFFCKKLKTKQNIECGCQSSPVKCTALRMLGLFDMGEYKS